MGMFPGFSTMPCGIGEFREIRGSCFRPLFSVWIRNKGARSKEGGIRGSRYPTDAATKRRGRLRFHRVGRRSARAARSKEGGIRESMYPTDEGDKAAREAPASNQEKVDLAVG
jgi:hypothetical protein